MQMLLRIDMTQTHTYERIRVGEMRLDVQIRRELAGAQAVVSSLSYVTTLTVDTSFCSHAHTHTHIIGSTIVIAKCSTTCIHTHASCVHICLFQHGLDCLSNAISSQLCVCSAFDHGLQRANCFRRYLLLWSMKYPYNFPRTKYHIVCAAASPTIYCVNAQPFVYLLAKKPSITDGC